MISVPISWKLCIKLIIIYPECLSIAVHADDHFAKITGCYSFLCGARTYSASKLKPDLVEFPSFSRSHYLSGYIRLLYAYIYIYLEPFDQNAAAGSWAVCLLLLKFVFSAVRRATYSFKRIIPNVGIGSKAQQRLPAASCYSSRYAVVVHRIGSLSCKNESSFPEGLVIRRLNRKQPG